MAIMRAGSQPSVKGSADYFTGQVLIDSLFSPPEPARVGTALVTFGSGARTAWHTHPLGQTLIATAVPWLCSPGASFVLGVALPVDGGFTAH